MSEAFEAYLKEAVKQGLNKADADNLRGSIKKMSEKEKDEYFKTMVGLLDEAVEFEQETGSNSVVEFGEHRDKNREQKQVKLQ